MKTLAAIAYAIGLLAELAGAYRIVVEAREAQRAAAHRDLTAFQRHLRAKEPIAIRADVDEVQRRSIPSTWAIMLLFGGIVFGYAGCFLSL